MAFTFIIAHQLLRNTPDESISTRLKQEPFALQGTLIETAQELKTQFIRKGGKQYGRFSTDTAIHPLSAWLAEYRAEKITFTGFTHKVMAQLKLELEQVESLIDGYLFFIEEQLEAGQTLYIVYVEHQHSVYLDGDLALDNSRFLDTSGFNLAVKINLTNWEQGESTTFVTLMRARGDKEFAEAFTRTTAFSDKHDIKTDTAKFLDIVETFSETQDEPTARLTRTKVVNYCLEQSKAGKPVVIAELSENLATEVKATTPEEFEQFVKTRQTEPTEEFIPDSGQIRNYVRISGRSDLLSMSFASECLGKEIEYDAERDVLMIKNIPNALKSKLLKHLKKSVN